MRRRERCRATRYFDVAYACRATPLRLMTHAAAADLRDAAMSSR